MSVLDCTSCVARLCISLHSQVAVHVGITSCQPAFPSFQQGGEAAQDVMNSCFSPERGMGRGGKGTSCTPPLHRESGEALSPSTYSSCKVHVSSASGTTWETYFQGICEGRTDGSIRKMLLWRCGREGHPPDDMRCAVLLPEPRYNSTGTDPRRVPTPAMVRHLAVGMHTGMICENKKVSTERQ